MKKTLFALSAFALATINVFAQSDQAVLNVKLHPIQTIEVNAAQKTINLDYTTVNDYATGVSSTQNDHLKIYSTGGFAVKVKSSADQIKRANGIETINASGISLQAQNGSTSPLTGATLNSVNLSTTANTLISNATGGVNKTFNITYKAAGADAYVNKYFKDENPTVYSTTVTYTIEAL